MILNFIDKSCFDLNIHADRWIEIFSDHLYFIRYVLTGT